MMRWIFLLTFVACSSGRVQRGVEEVRHAPMAAEYILPGIPAWGNFDGLAQCDRDKFYTYLDVPRLQQSFNLSYRQALEMQAFYNQDLNANPDSRQSGLEVEAQIFNNSLGKVQGDVAYLLVPEFPRIHLIWVDQAFHSPEALKRLRAFINSPVMNQGFPIFVSLCRGDATLLSWIQEQKWEELGARRIGAELFSPFLPNGSRAMAFDLDFSTFFPKGKQVVLIAPKEMPVLPPSWRKLTLQTW